MSRTVLVVGSVNVDLFAHVARHPLPGETVLGTGGRRAPGGKGANQALAARKQGATVRMVGAVGDDGDAAVAVELLQRAGVDLSRVVTAHGEPTGIAIITVAADGENTIVVVSGANAAVTADQALSAIRGQTEPAVVLLQAELPLPVVEEAVRTATAAGHRPVLNLAPYASMPLDVLRLVDPLLLNELEGRAVAGELGVDADDDEALVAGLVDAGIPAVVMTLGSRGALVADATGVQAVPTPAVRAVDTTGAGDAFAGALAARLADGHGLADAARHAARVGAYAVQRAGAQPSYPGLEDPLP